MPNFNKVILAGNLTRDPEMRHTSTGHRYARFGLAINRHWKNEAGEAKEEVTFVDVDAWPPQAELICQHLRKGSPLLMEGRLHYYSWDDKQTSQRRSKLSIILESFQFVGSGRNESSGPSARPASSPAPVPPAPAALHESAESGEADAPVAEPEDVPF